MEFGVRTFRLKEFIYLYINPVIGHISRCLTFTIYNYHRKTATDNFRAVKTLYGLHHAIFVGWWAILFSATASLPFCLSIYREYPFPFWILHASLPHPIGYKKPFLRC